jgi:segregation and condensation protein B
MSPSKHSRRRRKQPEADEATQEAAERGPVETPGADDPPEAERTDSARSDAALVDDGATKPEAEVETGATDASEREGKEADGGDRDKLPRQREKRTPRVKNPADAKAVLECLLFATVEPLSLRQIRQIIHPIDEKSLRALLVELQNDYDHRGSGLQVVEVAGGYQIATRSRYADWLVSFRKSKRRGGLSVAMLETLAIISYKQPIIRAEVDAIRGVDSSGVVHALQELDLVEVVGQKQVPGRPNLYGTTKTFLKYFGLKSLSDLPSIESLRERFELHRG